MTRYYYTDALEAAYMAKHHGVKLQVDKMKACIASGEPPYYPDDFLPLDVCNALVDCIRKLHWEREEQRFYIHPDSVHLLEPQEGDLLAYQHDDIEDVCWVGLHSQTYELVVQIDSLSWMSPIELHQTKVIQRNNKPFFWPEHD